MAYWLFKSDPEVYGFDHLLAESDRTTGWDGVRNYQARNFLRDSIKVGDGVLFYHSNADPAGIAGIAEVVRARPSRPHRVRSRVGAPRPQERSRQPHLVPGLDPSREGHRSAARFTTTERNLRARRHGTAPQGKPAVRSASDRTGMESHHGPGRREAEEEARVGCVEYSTTHRFGLTGGLCRIYNNAPIQAAGREEGKHDHGPSRTLRALCREFVRLERFLTLPDCRLAVSEAHQ